MGFMATTPLQELHLESSWEISESYIAESVIEMRKHTDMKTFWQIYYSQRGLTLIELIIFIVIIAVASTGVLLVFQQTVKGSVDPIIRKQAMTVAASLLEEVLAVEYACPATALCGNVTSSNRTATHGIVDYHGFAMNDGILAIDGTPIKQLADYSALVSVASESNWNGAPGRKISVSVRHQNETLTLDGWRGAN